MRFQFHFGTIDRNDEPKQSKLYISFNSTLVRLIVNGGLHVGGDSDPFQFHFGTIDRDWRLF